MSVTEDTRWELTCEDDTVTVELPADLKLDEEMGTAINEEFIEAVKRDEVSSVLTVLRVEDPLSSGVFSAVQQAGDTAVNSGVTQWAIVVEQQVKGMAFQSQLSDIDTKVFETEAAAREFLN